MLDEIERSKKNMLVGLSREFSGHCLSAGYHDKASKGKRYLRSPASIIDN
jgi:hypothetical protein